MVRFFFYLFQRVSENIRWVIGCEMDDRNMRLSWELLVTVKKIYIEGETEGEKLDFRKSKRGEKN